MGVGYASGGEFGNYWTVLLGCRPGVLPKVQFDGRTFESTENCSDITTVSAVQTGSDLEVRWSGIPSPADRDWLGLYRTTDADTAYVAWAYVSCAWMPLTPRDSGWCWLKLPTDLPSGTYDVRLFTNDTYQRLASTQPINLTRR